MRKMTIHFTVAAVTTILSGTLIAADSSANASHGASSQKEHTSSKPRSQTSQAQEAGKKISFNQLPAPVQKTMRTEAGNLNIENVQQITLNGQTCYQASFDKGSMKGRVTVAQDGSLLQYQETDQMALVSEVPKLNKTGMTLKDLPDAVQKTVKAQVGKSDVGDISKDTEKGQSTYHVAYNDQGIHTDLVLDQNGKVLLRSDETALYAAPLESSKALSLQSAPAAVQKAIREHGGSNTSVTDIDKGTWNGQTAYRVMIDRNGTSRPLLVSESGQILQGQNHDRSSASASGSAGGSEKSRGSDSQSASHSTKSKSQNSK